MSRGLGRRRSKDKNSVLKPVGPGVSEGRDDDPGYLKEIIKRLNDLFGDATRLRDQAIVVNHITSITEESAVVMAQVENSGLRNVKGTTLLVYIGKIR